MIYGYIRVSVASDADASNLENQRRALTGCDQIFEDVMTGGRYDRPGLQSLLSTVQEGDTITVVALDRLGRSVLEMLELLRSLKEQKVNVISHREIVDQESSIGRMMLTICLSLAEMERGLASERTKAGLTRVRMQGGYLGRRFVMTKEQVMQLQELREQGYSWGRIGKVFPGRSPRTLHAMGKVDVSKVHQNQWAKN